MALKSFLYEDILAGVSSDCLSVSNKFEAKISRNKQACRKELGRGN